MTKSYKVGQILQSETEVITNCDKSLLQSVTGITKCGNYCKVRSKKRNITIALFGNIA